MHYQQTELLIIMLPPPSLSPFSFQPMQRSLMLKKLEGTHKGLKLISNLRDTFRGRKKSTGDVDLSELTRFSVVGKQWTGMCACTVTWVCVWTWCNISCTGQAIMMIGSCLLKQNTVYSELVDTLLMLPYLLIVYLTLLVLSPTFSHTPLTPLTLIFCLSLSLSLSLFLYTSSHPSQSLSCN